MRPDPHRSWVPAYESGDGKLPVLIPARTLTQCPTGFVDAESDHWVDEFYRAKSATKATGSPLFRSLSDADPRTVSAFELLERENRMIDAELREAMTKQR